MRLEDFRILAGKSRPQAAADLGVDHVTYWRWETGRSVPRREQASRIILWSRGAVTINDLWEPNQHERQVSV